VNRMARGRVFVDVVGKINDEEAPSSSDDCGLCSARVADQGAQFFCANLATKQRGRTMLKSIIAAALVVGSFSITVATSAWAGCPPDRPYNCQQTFGGKQICGCGR